MSIGSNSETVARLLTLGASFGSRCCTHDGVQVCGRVSTALLSNVARLNNVFAATPTQIKEVPGIELNDINKMERGWYRLQPLCGQGDVQWLKKLSQCVTNYVRPPRT